MGIIQVVWIKIKASANVYFRQLKTTQTLNCVGWLRRKTYRMNKKKFTLTPEPQKCSGGRRYCNRLLDLPRGCSGVAGIRATAQLQATLDLVSYT